MKVKWLIEDFEEDNRFDELADAAREQGHEVEVIKYTPLQSGTYDQFDDDDCVIFQGSIQLGQQLLREKSWVPGAWMDMEPMKCSVYYPRLSEFLFNDQFTTLPRQDIADQSQNVWEIFSKSDCIFMRPDANDKSFTGKVFCKENFEADWQWVEEFTAPTDKVIISTPKNIVSEWRFIVAGSSIITGSQYKHNGRSVRRPLDSIDRLDELAKATAQVVADRCTFINDPMFVIDICSSQDNQCYLLELGCFSCAGLYACDKSIIVEEASKIAERQWNESRTTATNQR